MKKTTENKYVREVTHTHYKYEDKMKPKKYSRILPKKITDNKKDIKMEDVGTKDGVPYADDNFIVFPKIVGNSLEIMAGGGFCSCFW